jgi:hypothetical protein
MRKATLPNGTIGSIVDYDASGYYIQCPLSVGGTHTSHYTPSELERYQIEIELEKPFLQLEHNAKLQQDMEKELKPSA